MGDSLDLYDTSNFDPTLPQYSPDNRRVLGKFKSETASTPPDEFVGLRAKMYSLRVHGSPSKCFVQKHYVRKRVRHEHFVRVLRNVNACLNGELSVLSTFRSFKSTNHVMNTVEISKLCLCAFDDKRHIEDDGVHTLAYGHYKTREGARGKPSPQGSAGGDCIYVHFVINLFILSVL